MEMMESLLGPGGVVSRRWGQFESRPQQVEMATAVATALKKGEKLLVEAGTGVGKSFAYLVPAVQAIATRDQIRVVVSTHTIGLQEQILTATSRSCKVSCRSSSAPPSSRVAATT